MRLTCPNCGAQYEVPDEVIPYDGRDVQCSNCGHTWFQAHPETAAEQDRHHLNAALEAADSGAPAPEADDWDAPRPDTAGGPEPEAGADIAPGAEPDFDEDAPEPPKTPSRQELDSSISEILRQEAERETQLRAAEAGGLESQPELGLESPTHEAAQRAREARERMARMRGEEPGGAAREDHPASRREVFPDIEEINSTLRSSGLSSGATQSELPTGDDIPPRRSGFMRGFAVAFLIGAVLLLVYAKAPLIAQKLPQADPMLSAYVAMVDQARYWLDAQLGDFVTGVLPE